MVSVEKRWPGETFVCIGSGPSLTADDVAFVRGRARVIVINTSYKLAPWADVLYACDQRWWEWHHGAPDFAGLKFSLQPSRTSRWNTTLAEKWHVQVLQYTGEHGLELSPSGLKAGRNSGYQAINLAAHLGAKRVVLLGYDMQRGSNNRKHWHDPHPVDSGSVFHKFLRHFESIAEPLKALGIEVVNASRETALQTFPRVSLADALCREAVAA